MKQTRLHEYLYKSTVSNLGSDEHLQIAGELANARKVLVDTEAAAKIRYLLDRDPWQFEKHFDVLERPSEPVWYEWGIKTRSGHGGTDEAKTGCLIIPHPASDDLLLIITGWSSGEPGQARHAYGVALVGVSHFHEIARKAKFTIQRNRETSLARILDGIEITMPSGFHDEISILSDNDPNAIEAALRDAAAEVPYLLAILISLKCDGGIKEEVSSDGEIHAKLCNPAERSLNQTFFDRLRGRREYIASSKNGLTWYI